MPFVCGREVSPITGNKRRKLSGSLVMARSHWDDVEQDTLEIDGNGGYRKESTEPEREIQTSNREELIECIKRGENAVWVPSPALEALTAQHAVVNNAQNIDVVPEVAAEMDSTSTDMIEQAGQAPYLQPHAISEPIERSRSALHTGDFREDHPPSTPRRRAIPSSISPTSPPFTPFSSSPPLWLSSIPIPSLSRLQTDSRALADSSAEVVRRARAPSLGSSLSSSFVMRVPTSPLVHATNNTSLDFSPESEFASLSTSSDKANRRRTLPPGSFRSLQTTPIETRTPNFSRPFARPSLHREASLPQQGHRPRRSLTSVTYQPLTNATMPPFLRSRRPSGSSDASPRAPMVGSFEESILRGRMSTAPSKPLDFVAQIGVLGKGNCKPSLLCPAHVTVPFPAVFYSYPSIHTGRSFTDEHPSPYVGSIDLEHNLKAVEPARPKKEKRREAQDTEELMADITSPENTAIGRALARDAKAKKRPSSPKAPPGGCYRVPQQGQLQIIIKNPNKTAVKLYLVPYDLEGIEPGSKTFVRQRSYSAGPILEKPLTENPQAHVDFDPLKDKHVLRYLVHLKFCCVAKDRFYLYDNIRVVFANRVPDGKEKLRNEVQLPQPKYSPYKPGRETTSIGSDAKRDKVARRESLKAALPPPADDLIEEGHSAGVYISSDKAPPLPSSAIPFHVTPRKKVLLTRSDPPSQSGVSNGQRPVPDIPFRFPDLARAISPESDAGRTVSPTSGFHPSTSARGSPVPWSGFVSSSSPRSFSPAPPEAGDGLLSRKLRSLNGNVSSNGK